MAEKSIEFKIGADTSDFIKSMKKADKEVGSFQKTASYLEQGLKIKFDEGNFKQAQASAQKALELTELKAQKLNEELAYLEKSGKVNTADYNKLETELAKTNTKALQLKQKLDEINALRFTNIAESFTKVGNNITKAGKAMTGLSVAAAAALASIAKLATSAAQNADDINTLSASYNLSTTSIQKWSYIAEQSGIDSEKMYKAIQKINNALGEQLIGSTDEATKALDLLGINMSDFGDDSEGAFTATLYALANITDSTQRAAVATNLFGDEVASQVLAVLSQGTGTIEEYAKEFEQIGYLSEDQISSLNDFNNELKKLKLEFSNVGAEIAEALLPVLNAFADFVEKSVVPAIRSFSDWLGNLNQGQQEFIVGALATIAALAPILIAVGKMITGIGAIIKVLPGLIALVKGFNTVALTTVATVGALAAAMGLVIDLVANWNQLTTVQKVLKGLAAAALATAAAIMVFHSAWSLGTAMTGILAGIALATGAVLGIASQFGIDSSESSSNISGGTSAIASSAQSTATSSTVASAGSTTTTTDNSVTNINVNVEGTNATVEEITEAVTKALATRVQVRQ